MKKTMSRLIALVLALMLVLGATAMASELTSDPFHVSGVKPRPTQQPAEPDADEVEPAQPDAAEPTAEPEQEPEVEPTEAPQPVESKPQTHTLRVVAGCEQANVRSGPGRDFEAIATVSAGDVVKCFGAEGDWMRVQLASGAEGYIFGIYLQPLGGAQEAPAEPEQPAEPETPAEPEIPAEPEQPAEPEIPAEPEQPAEPETPAEPEQPAEPGETEQPVVQDEPIAPEEAPSYNIGDEVEMSEDVDVRLAADGMSEIIETVVTGGKLTVLAVEGDWVLVDLGNGVTGYVYIDDLPGLILPEQPEEPELPEGKLPPVKVTIFTSRRSVMAPGETVNLTSKIENLELYSEHMMQWQVDKGDGFEDVPGATEDNYSFEASVETLAYDWQLLVYYR